MLCVYYICVHMSGEHTTMIFSKIHLAYIKCPSFCVIENKNIIVSK